MHIYKDEKGSFKILFLMTKLMCLSSLLRVPLSVLSTSLLGHLAWVGSWSSFGIGRVDHSISYFTCGRDRVTVPFVESRLKAKMIYTWTQLNQEHAFTKTPQHFCKAPHYPEHRPPTGLQGKMPYKDIVSPARASAYAVSVSRNTHYIESFALWGNKALNRFLCT